MFLDTAETSIKAGRGGNGMVAFRCGKYVPNGGPQDGNGGRGGSVIFKVGGGLRALMDFHHNRIFRTKSGEKRMTKGMHGRGAEDLIARVPQRTTVCGVETNKVITDLVENSQEFVVTRGEHGRRGNIRFTTPRNPTSRIAENGEPDEERDLQLGLKILTGVGLVGFPSAGKSTLLSVVIAVKPKIGAYHSTAIMPNLGMVRTKSDGSFTMADLPGLIEGASQGVGLSTRFLHHIGRTRATLHVIDMSVSGGRDPYEGYVSISNELGTCNLRLMERPQIIVVNKMDMPKTEESLRIFKEKLTTNCDDFEEIPVIFPISNLTHQGLENLMEAITELLAKTDEFLLYTDGDMIGKEVYHGFDPGEHPFEISRDDGTAQILSDEKLEKLFVMTSMKRNESVTKFARQLCGMGVNEALRECGAKDGDIVRIGNFEFEFVG